LKRVDTIARVRRAFHVQGLSVKRIARELYVSRNTVRKILRSDETDFIYERERQPMPRIGPWQEKLDAFLVGNANKASRERLTLIRIYEDLRSAGYEGGYDAVRRYARALRANKSETFDCLKFTLEGAGERSDGYARTPRFRLAFLA
jgi:transcriptional regulator with XRE-family HTH domain